MKKKEFLKSLILKGVNIIDINSTFIDESCKIGKNTTIFPNNFITSCDIGDNCIIEPNNYLIDCKIGKHNKISNSCLENCKIGENNNIGNFSNLKNTVILDDNKIESFVNITSSKIKNNVIIKSSTSLENCEIGDKTIVSYGVVMCSIKNKNLKIIVGDNCFVGSNVNIISPVLMGDSNYIYSGVNLYKNIENNKFVATKNELIIKQDYHNK